MAFLHFSEEAVDMAIMETGLGGRLDTTNLCQARSLTLITRIELDHMHILGKDLVSIAREKGRHLQGRRARDQRAAGTGS